MRGAVRWLGGEGVSYSSTLASDRFPTEAQAMTKKSKLTTPFTAEQWTVSAPAWTPGQGHDAVGNPKLTILQSVCALGLCIQTGADEDAFNHCQHILYDLWKAALTQGTER